MRHHHHHQHQQQWKQFVAHWWCNNRPGSSICTWKAAARLNTRDKIPPMPLMPAIPANQQKRFLCTNPQNQRIPPPPPPPPPPESAPALLESPTVTAAQMIHTSISQNQRSRAINQLQRILKQDAPSFTRASSIIHALLLDESPDAGHIRAYVCMRALKQSRYPISTIPRCVLEWMVPAVLRHGRYDDVVYLGAQVADTGMGAAAGRAVLTAIRRLQTVQERETRWRFSNSSNSSSSSGRRREGTWLHFDPVLYAQTQCPFRLEAQRTVDKLSGNNTNAGSVTAGHLAKQLEIDMSSLLPETQLPREMLPWLQPFLSRNLLPNVHALTIILHTYVRRGDFEFARWVYAQMQAGEMRLTRADYSIQVVPLPAPNEITDALMVPVMRGKDWTRESVVSERDEKSIGTVQRLVTRKVAQMVDSGDLGGAEKEALGGGTGAGNVRALAKIALGHAHAGNSGRALSMFRSSCQAVAALGSTNGLLSSSYFTSMFNSVLRASLQPNNAAGSGCAQEVLRVARLHGVVLDVGSYTIVLARLSTLAEADVCHDGVVKERRDLVGAALVMQRVYVDMVLHGVELDDMALSLMVPLWVLMDMRDLVLANWHHCTRGRLRAKAVEVRRHVLHRAHRWGVGDRTAQLID